MPNRFLGYVPSLARGDILCVGKYPLDLRIVERGNPLIIGGVSNDDAISQTELFGPVGVVIPFDDVEEAIRIANTTTFGLNANVWGRTSEAMEVARRIRSGTVTINGGGGMRPDAPWGGYGLSGIGREGGEEGFLEYLETKHIQWPIDGEPTKPFGTR